MRVFLSDMNSKRNPHPHPLPFEGRGGYALITIWGLVSVVDIATPEFSLKIRYSGGCRRCKILWPKKDNLIVENEFNGRVSRRDLKRAKLPLARERAGRVTFTTLATATRMARADEATLGGKGANLQEMTRIGLPVPPGFTITTEVCTYFSDNNRTYPKQLEAEVELRWPR